jgi:hypothetical protein
LKVLKQVHGTVSEPRAKPQSSPVKPRPKVAAPKKTCGRSAVSNGRKLLLSDNRTVWGRRFCDLVSDHAQDLGGIDNLSEAEIGLLRRASAIECELERREAQLAAGEEVDLDEFARAASHCRRLWETLGVSRKPREKQVTLGDVVARHSKKAAEKPAESLKPAPAPTDQPAPEKPAQPAPGDAQPVVEPASSAAIDAGQAVAPVVEEAAA